MASSEQRKLLPLVGTRGGTRQEQHWGQGWGEQRNEPAAHRGPGQCQGRKAVPVNALVGEGLWDPQWCLLGTLGCRGKCVSLATRMPAMVEGAGVPDSPSSKEALHPSFLIRREGTHVSPVPLPSQAGPLPSLLGSWPPSELAFLCSATKGRRRKRNRKTAQSRF